MTVVSPSRPSTLAEWLATMAPAEASGPECDPSAQGPLRFLFYGRASTAEHQDPRTSRAWQFDIASRLVEEHGRIVAEYFDTACSRQVPWHRRPQAAALLEALGDPTNPIDGIVVGEYERAFDIGQLDALRPVLERHGVRLWLPEAGGPVEFGSLLHDALATVLAARSHAEVVRARHRVVTAMRMQTIEQGRYLGGRPPYGYRLVDAGPHPNRALARRGVRLHRLAPDPVTAPHVMWIFAQRLAGHSTAHIARRLNEQAIPGPSGADPARNPHRRHHGWSLRSVTEILRNPRYTGYQVWNRTGADRTGRSASGRRPTARNRHQDWVISTHIAHPPLVSEQDFLTVQTVHAGQVNACGGKHVYQLSGRLHCGLCGRRMDSHWVHNRPAYRCRHGYTSAQVRPDGTPPNLYLREDHLLVRMAAYLPHAGIATDPTPKQTVRLVRELGLVFRCDTTTVTLVEPQTVALRTTTTRHDAADPAPHGPDGGPSSVDEPGGEVDTGQLALDLCFEPEVPEPGGPSVLVDRANATRRHRQPHPIERRHEAGLHRYPAPRRIPEGARPRLRVAPGRTDSDYAVTNGHAPRRRKASPLSRHDP